MSQDLVHIWPAVQRSLRRRVDASSYDVWLEPVRAVAVDGNRLTLEAPAALRDWVAERFGRPLAAAAADVLGPGARVELIVAAAAGQPQRQSAHGAEPADVPGPPGFPDAVLNPKFTFGQFVIGDANRLAHAAALAVAEGPGLAYNPLFVYGPPGVGKTHLLHSIGHYVRASGSGMSVHYTTVERFTNEFIAALQQGSNAAKERFKDRYRRNDVLLIDDVQFLVAKAKTEEEFFHTFNALYDTGSQLVLTSDRLPRDLGGLEDRMRERFESGLVTDVRAPDLATRLTVLHKRAQHDAITIADPRTLDVIARRIPTNIRALEGALIRVVAYASLTGRPLGPELADEVLDGLYGAAAPRAGDDKGRARIGYGAPAVTVARVQELVCQAFGLSREDLLSSGRTARLTWPRQVAMYLSREHTDESLPAIGREFGGRNHTTVMHAVKRTAARMDADPEARAVVHELTARLTGQADRRS